MFVTDVLAAGLRIGTPLALAGMGETFSERAGIINVELEGVMLTGAFTAAIATHYSENVWFGLLAAAAGGLLVAGIHALICIKGGGNQIISGIALNLVALGLTGFLHDALFPGYGLTTKVGFYQFPIPGLSTIPIVGPILFDQSVDVYFLYLLVPACVFLLYRTHWGLSVMASGESPQAADAVGISVAQVRYQALIFAGVMGGLAGGFLVLSELRAFVDNMTQGIGYIALASVIFGNWRPGFVACAGVFFGIISSLQLRLQAVGIGIQPELLSALPYALVIIVLGGLLVRSRPPAYFGVPYTRGQD